MAGHPLIHSELYSLKSERYPAKNIVASGGRTSAVEGPTGGNLPPWNSQSGAAPEGGKDK